MRNPIFHFLWQLTIRFIIAFRLKNRIPTKISAPSWRYNTPHSLAHKKSRLLLFSSFVGYDAHGIGGFVRERFNHFSETFWAQVFEEPFDVWTRESFVGVEAERSVLNDDWPFGMFKCKVDFCSWDLEGVSLQFWYYMKVLLQLTFWVWKSNYLPSIWLNSSSFFF
jgi:hypothetical protein